MISPVVTSLISSAKDEDKKDKRLYQLIVYILTRFMWESYTPYRAEDLFNNVKSPSAATSMMDKLESAGHSFYKTIFPQQTLYDTFFNSESSSKQLYDPNVKRGVYKNMPYPLNKKLGRDLFKLFVPAHNAVEQWYDARTKENYYTN
ncbi:hypothetical protein [Sharpea azabuensis]|uniref:hypothetical protein n=1 Tax=Sharpea azabuensis TaxID=322505 RepID=UPI001569E241|nr:hypothetical protein [Sharpea azabuensis]